MTTSPSYAVSLERLISIMNELREHCPWDKRQTIESLKTMTIEETYELADAIMDKDWPNIKEELGDLLLHIVFYSRLAQEENQFSIKDVIATVSQKLVQRHPHIYADVQADNEDEVKRNWEKIKLRTTSSLLDGVPKTLPAMVKALRLQEKTKQVGFEWEYTDQVKQKLQEELNELDEAIAAADHEEIENELGDVFFSLINYARFLKVDPETALERTNKKFMQRFQTMEIKAEEMGYSLSEMNLEQMDELWNAIKKQS